MARPTAHLLALLELLQTGGTRSAGELGARLGVDERTVRRYIAHLIDLGMPVEALRGRYGGFRMISGAHLPPLMITEEEAFAVVIGLGVVARTGPSAAARAASETAAAKLMRVLPRRTADRLVGLHSVRSTARSVPAPTVDLQAVLVASRALDEGRPVRIAHRREGVMTERTVLPRGVVEHRGRWYLVGLDSASDAIRTFRLDRVERIEIGQGRFTRPIGADPVAELTASLAGAPRRHEVAFEVCATEPAVRRLLPESVAGVVPGAQDGWLLVTIQAERLDWVAGVLAQLDAPFRVLRPIALSEEVRSLAHRLLGRLAEAEAAHTDALPVSGKGVRSGVEPGFMRRGG